MNVEQVLAFTYGGTEMLRTETLIVAVAVSIVIATVVPIMLLVLSSSVAAARKSSSVLRSKPSQLITFTTSVSPSDTAKAVLRLVRNGRYDAEEISEDRNHIVLSEPPTLTTWGFFYPIYLTDLGEEGTLVEIGIKSKLVQLGPIKHRAHERFANSLKSVLLAEGAAVS